MDMKRAISKTDMPYEADEIYRRSRSIRVPQQDGKRMLAEYIIHKPNGKFGTLRLIEDGPGLQHLYVSPVIDFYVPRAHARIMISLATGTSFSH